MVETMQTNAPTATDSPADGSPSLQAKIELGREHMQRFVGKVAMLGSSKGKEPTFGIVLNSTVVASGATLAGRVWADIPSVFIGTEMHVDFVGGEETKVTYENGEHRRAAYNQRDIFRIALPVSEQLNLNRAGKYVMPFSAVLPAFLPSTMKIKANQGYAKITYKVKMALILKRSGLGPVDYTAEAPVTITASSIARHVPYDGPPCEKKVESCGCFGRDLIWIGASVDNTSLAKGQPAVISYACRNQSRYKIKDIYAKLQEVAVWSANKHQETYSQTLHTTRFPITAVMLKGMDKQELVDELRSRKNSASFLLPKSANNTYNGSIIQVEHKLTLRVKTGGWYTSNAQLEIPIHSYDVMKPSPQQGQQQPIYDASAIPFAVNSPDVITTEAIICTSSEFNYVYGGAARPVSGENTDEENYDIPSVAVATPIVGGQQQPTPPSLAHLLSKMQEAGVGDRDVVMNLYGTNNPPWDKFFAQLSPQDYAAIIGQISTSFDESDVAVYLAADKMVATFTCDHVARAVRITEAGNRTNLIEKLIPYCIDFHLKPNRTRILSSLDGWDRCKAEVVFQEYLQSMADAKHPQKYIPHPKYTGTVMLNPAYADSTKASVLKRGRCY